MTSKKTEKPHVALFAGATAGAVEGFVVSVQFHFIGIDTSLMLLFFLRGIEDVPH